MKIKYSLLILVLVLIYGCSKDQAKQVTIEGKVINPKGENIAFNSKDTSYTSLLNKDGSFSISFILDSASYISFFHGVEQTAMYIKPGDKIKLEIDADLFDESIKYKGSKTSSFLAKKYLIEEKSDFFGENYYISNLKEYKEELESYKSKITDQLSEIQDSIFINNEILDIDNIISYLLERKEKLSEYTIDARKYMWETQQIAKNYNFYNAIDSLDRDQFDKMIGNYASDFKKLLKDVEDSKFIKEAEERIKKTKESWISRKELSDLVPKKGEKATDFTYPDQNEKLFSLSDYEDHLVYVDVWATWCGPCKAEIPSLKKLEKEYEEKNIVFLSVSVDEDKEAWINMINKEELGGVQLWANGWSQITKDYAIFGIPRFMLFSVNGNVISTDAPRPSSEEIRPLLDANL